MQVNAAGCSICIVLHGTASQQLKYTGNYWYHLQQTPLRAAHGISLRQLAKSEQDTSYPRQSRGRRPVPRITPPPPPRPPGASR